MSKRDLIVWKRAVELVPLVYSVVRGFPVFEKFALADQTRRAVISIAANIAEGQGRQHPKEFLQHLSIARGSLAELHTLLVVAQRLDYVDSDRLAELENELAKVARPLHGLIANVSNGV